VILTTRRELIGFAGGTGLAGVMPGCSVASPAVVAGEITPERFGAGNRDPVADTMAWSRAVDEAARSGRPVVANGTYVLRVPAASRWNWARQPTGTVHVAVPLRSGVAIEGTGVILVAPPERAALNKNERHFLFGTDLNIRPGSLRDITFDGLTFDFRDEYGPVHSYTYAIGASGVDNLRRNNLKIVSTGAQAGRGLLSENARGRVDAGLTHRNIVQGTYSRYERGVAMRGIRFDTFNEAMDFDGPCWDVSLDDLQFRNGRREAQCIDIGGGSNWNVVNVTAQDTGAVVYIYRKANAWPTYVQWLESDGAGTAAYIAPTAMTFRGVRAINAGWAAPNGEAVRIGSFRTREVQRRVPAEGPLPRDIVLADWILTGGGQIAVNDCENLTLTQIVLDRVGAPDDAATGAALVLREGPLASGGQVTGRVTDLTIRSLSSPAMIVVAGSGLEIDGVNIEADSTRSQGAIRLGMRDGGQSMPVMSNTRLNGVAAPGSVVQVDQPRDAASSVAEAAEERRERRRLRRSGPTLERPADRRRRPAGSPPPLPALN
jgi:hypothetical protein